LNVYTTNIKGLKLIIKLYGTHYYVGAYIIDMYYSHLPINIIVYHYYVLYFANKLYIIINSDFSESYFFMCLSKNHLEKLEAGGFKSMYYVILWSTFRLYIYYIGRT